MFASSRLQAVRRAQNSTKLILSDAAGDNTADQTANKDNVRGLIIWQNVFSYFVFTINVTRWIEKIWMLLFLRSQCVTACLRALTAMMGSQTHHVDMWTRGRTLAISPSPSWSSGEASPCWWLSVFWLREHASTSSCPCRRPGTHKPTLLWTGATVQRLQIKAFLLLWSHTEVRLTSRI